MDSILNSEELALLRTSLAAEALQDYQVVMLAKDALGQGDVRLALKRLLVDVDKFFCIAQPLSKLLMRKRVELLA